MNRKYPLQLTSGLKGYRRPWGAEQASHLLKRTLFGSKKEDVDYFGGKSLKKCIRELIYTQYEIPGPPVNGYNDDKYCDQEIPEGQTWIGSLTYNGMNNGRRRNSFKSWWFGLMLNQDRSLREKMVLFWHNHFVTETNTVDNKKSASLKEPTDLNRPCIYKLQFYSDRIF